MENLNPIVRGNPKRVQQVILPTRLHRIIPNALASTPHQSVNHDNRANDKTQ